jgi:hypothetical protein
MARIDRIKQKGCCCAARVCHRGTETQSYNCIFLCFRASVATSNSRSEFEKEIRENRCQNHPRKAGQKKQREDVDTPTILCTTHQSNLKICLK